MEKKVNLEDYESLEAILEKFQELIEAEHKTSELHRAAQRQAEEATKASLQQGKAYDRYVAMLNHAFERYQQLSEQTQGLVNSSRRLIEEVHGLSWFRETIHEIHQAIDGISAEVEATRRSQDLILEQLRFILPQLLKANGKSVDLNRMVQKIERGPQMIEEISQTKRLLSVNIGSLNELNLQIAQHAGNAPVHLINQKGQLEGIIEELKQKLVGLENDFSDL